MLLIDDLLAAPRCEGIDKHSWPTVKTMLGRAQMFELAPDFAASAEEIAEQFDVIANAVPHCRLPFPVTWIEVAQKSRPRFSTAGVHLPGIQKIPHRVGFLLTAEDDKQSVFLAHQFWRLSEYPVPHGCCVAMHFDPKRGANAPDMPADDHVPGRLLQIKASPSWYKASPSTRGKLTMMATPCQPKYLTDIPIEAYLDADTTQVVLEIGMADWSGEAVFLLAVLGLMNTLNAAATTTVQKTALNKARAKKRLPPLLNHYVLSISARLKKRVHGGGTEGGNQYRHLRAHLCRGHWKCRKTGIYWWRAHTRGNATEGKIEKTYKVIA